MMVLSDNEKQEKTGQHGCQEDDIVEVSEGEQTRTTTATIAIDEKIEYSSIFPTRDSKWHASYKRKLVRRLDLRLLPVVILMYTLNFLDRTNLAQARLGTLEKDLKMTGTDFNLATSIFFVAYVVMQLPSNLILTRVRPSLYLGISMLLWGIVSTVQAAAYSFKGLLATRIFLGFVEAPFYPGVTMLISSWYTTDEITLRLSWFFAGILLANMVGGLLGAAVLGNLEGAHGIAGWRWLFIIEGSITVGLAIISMFLLPNFPSYANWLSDEERAYAEWRLTAEAKEADDPNSTTLLEGLRMALVDWRVYIFMLFNHALLLSMTFVYFFPSIVQTLGYSTIHTLLLTAPIWFLVFLVCLISTYSAGRTGDRSIHIICLLLISLVGNLIVVISTKSAVRFFGMFLMPLGAMPAVQIGFSWIATSFPRPMVKRSATIAMCSLTANIASIYGSYMFPASAAPQYIAGGSANAGLCVLVAGITVVLRLVHARENRKLEKAELEPEIEQGEGRKDVRGKGFRYLL
ncbi:hypothetical protein AJ80_08231 [Polytolypa hystricis UAMH7299]|uniref:Major facilitator superfamily (MFS) profile domain-containing protein n=1 Tax=Polytolypa hystricis (strain UAMH7299) TaxID=1447883 RepID=A0A2B7XBA5_POLH7|nr:hypothetical protein AJ80_08231 [Polytolypa hystricis UAMH7299]